MKITLKVPKNKAENMQLGLNSGLIASIQTWESHFRTFRSVNSPQPGTHCCPNHFRKYLIFLLQRCHCDILPNSSTNDNKVEQVITQKKLLDCIPNDILCVVQTVWPWPIWTYANLGPKTNRHYSNKYTWKFTVVLGAIALFTVTTQPQKTIKFFKR